MGEHVLVVDDEEDLCELLALRLEHHGYRVTSRHTVRDGLAVLEQEHVDVVVLDLRLDHEHGSELLRELERRSLRQPTIVLTADGVPESASQSRESNVLAFLAKPFDPAELLTAIRRAAHAA